MPELAEIETVKNDLKSAGIIGCKFISVDILDSKVIGKKSWNLSKSLNQEILDVFRKGKYLVFQTTKYFLALHFKMTGHVFLKNKNYKRQKHEHLILHLDNDKKLIYYDPRKFGKIYLFNDLDDFFKNTGKDPFEMSFADFQKAISTKNKNIKFLLLDQSIISGIGNIYVNEALYLAKIHPAKSSDIFSNKELKVLFASIKKVLSDGIKNKGTTLGSSRANFSSIHENRGNNQNHLLVHGKKNGKCKMCKSLIKNIKIAQRSSYFCPKCQC